MSEASGGLLGPLEWAVPDVLRKGCRTTVLESVSDGRRNISGTWTSTSFANDKCNDPSSKTDFDSDVDEAKGGEEVHGGLAEHALEFAVVEGGGIWIWIGGELPSVCVDFWVACC